MAFVHDGPSENSAIKVIANEMRTLDGVIFP